ncbi:MAG: hypothetical protein Q8L66_13500 [Caulobacter sp.]|nr:hypothetical protein [Caulobacter sp.]
MSTRAAIAESLAVPAGTMTARALFMSKTSKIITDPSGPELARAT